MSTKFQIPDSKFQPGFTLLESIIAIAIMLMLVGGGVLFYGKFYTSSQLNEATTQMIQTIRIARERAVARVNDVPHGVYFEVLAGNDQYVLYQGGATYATRVPSYDLVTTLDPALSFSATIDVNFTKGTGAATPATITLNHVNDGARVITVNAFGVVEQ